jgi:hypothetical protein
MNTQNLVTYKLFYVTKTSNLIVNFSITIFKISQSPQLEEPYLYYIKNQSDAT